MSEVYNECTCCYGALSSEEMQMNKEHELYYYPICEECLLRSVDRFFQIATEM
ncbi:hypothetical protein IMZ31_20490 (plasmid) [Pontibacillus sp. ALD_SL1]|uniref:hypothetical protein n=1 Tax=Pontibacillus sp. ALD_SL1 TaxID=2777185 RepID=UPI001A959631|nr:hypothetical protein [Pontibacillus sp. ALD_SL1]QST02929.1 hypothetical protein IMZ31_20490 [Pontibacillus sp. ALD_SL1]